MRVSFVSLLQRLVFAGLLGLGLTAGVQAKPDPNGPPEQFVLAAANEALDVLKADVERVRRGRYRSRARFTLPARWHGAFRYASCFRASKGAGMGNPRQSCPRLRLKF